MKGFSPFMDDREDDMFRNLDFNSFRPPAPEFSCFRDSLFQPRDSFGLAHHHKNPKEGIEALFENKKSLHGDEHANFDFEDPIKGMFNKEKEEDFNFLYHDEARPEPFRKPFEKKEAAKSCKDSDTVSNTKEVSSPHPIRETNSIFNLDTRSEVLSQSKRNVIDGFAYFQDLCPVKEEELPPLNTLFSLTINQGSSNLSLNLCSCKLSSCKLLHNFVQLAEDSELAEMIELLDGCKADLEVTLAKLKCARE
mmetsp:Transcript_35467/g.41023  ORF Transcript_35467/g.41023 Transcript_35467/m.41023 type:complete len:251 (-) Transcript_35467:97-849(-)